VFGFVKQSGGHITVESKVGHGTTFRLYLPAEDGGASAQVNESATGALASVQREKILVVEDEPQVRNVAVQMLAELGYRVIEASSGPSALALLATHRDIDLLFTDVVMPGGMSGYELAAKARKTIPGISLLVTTGYADTHSAPAAGLNEVMVLKKPYEESELAQKVRVALSSR